ARARPVKHTNRTKGLIYNRYTAMEVKSRLDRGVSPNGEGRIGEPMLTRAIGAGDMPTARILLERGADAQEGDYYAVRVAAQREQPEFLELLLSRGVDAYGKAAGLRSAIGFSRWQSIQLLLKAGADVNRADEDGRTALITAAQYGSRIHREAQT